MSSALALCYHAVSRTWDHRLSIHPDLLLRQVRALGRFRQVHATFDDAFRSAATVLPELRALGVSTQIFVCSGLAHEGAPLRIPELQGDDLDELSTMTWEHLRTQAATGTQIGSHTVTHAHLPRLSDAELRRELSQSREQIEEELGRPCTDLAYPYGECDGRVRAAARAAGYARAYALWRSARADPYDVPRLDLYRRHSPLRAVLMTTPLHRLVA